jgi:hypothetical protein
MTLNLSASGKEKGELACERGEKPAHKRSDCINRRGVVEDIAPTGPKVRAVKVESNAKRAAHEPFGRNRIHAAHAR